MNSILGVSVGASAVRMARPAFDSAVHADGPFQFRSVPVGDAAPEEVAADAIVAVVEGDSPHSIGVAYRDDRQAAGLQRALARRRITNYRLIPESAAALHHLHTSGRIEPAGLIALYDLGASGTSVRIVDSADGRVLAAERSTEIHGDRFDRLIRDEQLAKQTGPLDADALHELEVRCRQAKEQLSSSGAVCVPGPAGLVLLSRETLEAILAVPIERTARLTKRLIESVPRDVDNVAVIGGGGRIPLVHATLSNWLGIPIVMPAEPELVVARGASLLAAPVTNPYRVGAPAPAPRSPAPFPPPPIVSPGAGTAASGAGLHEGPRVAGLGEARPVGAMGAPDGHAGPPADHHARSVGDNVPTAHNGGSDNGAADNHRHESYPRREAPARPETYGRPETYSRPETYGRRDAYSSPEAYRPADAYRGTDPYTQPGASHRTEAIRPPDADPSTPSAFTGRTNGLPSGLHGLGPVPVPPAVLPPPPVRLGPPRSTEAPAESDAAPTEQPGTTALVVTPDYGYDGPYRDPDAEVPDVRGAVSTDAADPTAYLPVPSDPSRSDVGEPVGRGSWDPVGIEAMAAAHPIDVGPTGEPSTGPADSGSGGGEPPASPWDSTAALGDDPEAGPRRAPGSEHPDWLSTPDLAVRKRTGRRKIHAATVVVGALAAATAIGLAFGDTGNRAPEQTATAVTEQETTTGGGSTSTTGETTSLVVTTTTEAPPPPPAPEPEPAPVYTQAPAYTPPPVYVPPAPAPPPAPVIEIPGLPPIVVPTLPPIQLPQLPG